MIEHRRNEYNPDKVSAPGETLLDILEERSLSQAELSERTGRPLKTINEIIRGKTALTPDTAIQLERVLRIPAEFWNQREANYRAYLASSKEQERLNSYGKWVGQFPVREMVNRKWIPECGRDKIAQAIALLNFFGVATPEQWTEGWTKHRLAFRTSKKHITKIGPTSVWLRRGEIEAEQVDCKPFNRNKLIENLPKIKALTRESDPQKFLPTLRELYAEAGVAVVLVRSLPGVPISGASKWLNPQKAMIQLSVRGKSDDLFWFTVFHELNHILHHSKKEMSFNLDGEKAQDTPEEHEADTNTGEQFIPSTRLDDWIKNTPVLSAGEITKFAKEMGVSPGIVVGRLQFIKKISFSSQLNTLKVRYEWKEN
jgi:HTH-type transcriptional regulator / antitoxin HigA